MSLTLATALAGCNRAPDDLREWTPADHHHTAEPNRGQVTGEPDPDTAKPPPGLEDVTIVAWRRNCMRCHGVVGRGDGAQGAMLGATDLSNPAWQAKASDEQIASVIQHGKGAMPPFDLPEATVQKLVKLVRLFNAARKDDSAAAPPGSNAPDAEPAPSAGAPNGSGKPGASAKPATTAPPANGTKPPAPAPTQQPGGASAP
ncbi:MAG: c-type cytochrome [Polyangiaceae bacterium]|nr:c-type cytochrome [Polyangiaceae bacterium]MCB9608472.1 c-type cytochrome [Polyangiaceae bacterium]